MPRRWLLRGPGGGREHPDGPALVALYALALFLAAALLFGAQPMAVRMVLPSAGGSPATWNTAQVLFQLLLLAGYLYAHGVARLADLRLGVGVHLAVLLAALAALPVALPAHWSLEAIAASPVPGVLALLAISAGLPFFAVATTAPLLQSWFSRTRHGHAHDPYFLYSASNLGGLVALLGYPLLLEPALGLAQQAALWAIGYAALLVLVAAAGVSLLRRPGPAPDAAPGSDAAARPSPATRVRWLLLAFAPSSLMLGVTLHISTDVAATPLLWVIPLALYLASWVITFARAPLLRHAWMLRAQPALVAALAVFFDVRALLPAFALHLGAFFACAMVCHGELARTRPRAARLTEFYLWLSLGGVLGGAFSGIVAPLLFDSVLEYPAALVLACALRPAPGRGSPRTPHGNSSRAPARAALRPFDLLAPLALAALYLLASRWLGSLRHAETGHALLAAGACVALLLWALHGRVTAFALACALVLAVTRTDPTPSERLTQARSFFGVHRVLAVHREVGIERGTRRYHLLTHGTTVHGAQSWGPDPSPEPLTYYTRDGPGGQVFAALAAHRPAAHVGVIGLGNGSLTCHLQPGQRMTYFEIDPLVVALASDPRYFRFLEACGERTEVVLGDGRLSVQRWDGPDFDLLVLDAFSSDAVPVHLLTREALAGFAERLAPGGALLLHLSNRHLDLLDVAAATAFGAGLGAKVQDHAPAPHAGPYHWPSRWLLAAPDPQALRRLGRDPRWRVPLPRARPWSDGYADVASTLRW